MNNFSTSYHMRQPIELQMSTAKCGKPIFLPFAEWRGNSIFHRRPSWMCIGSTSNVPLKTSTDDRLIQLSVGPIRSLVDFNDLEVEVAIDIW